MGKKEESNTSCNNNLGTTTDFIDRARNTDDPAIFFSDDCKKKG